jgi:hypothetical protein
MQVLGTVWVNQHVIPAWMFQMEAMLRGLLCVNIEWEAAARRRQASCGNPVSSHAGVSGVIRGMMYCKHFSEGSSC